MKIRILKWVAMAILCFCKTVCLQASLDINPSDNVIELAQKFYISADQILLSNNKIYIIVDNITHETPAMFSDENGYYIEQVAKSGNCSWYEWKCTRCGFCNMRGLDFECRACGFPISY